LKVKKRVSQERKMERACCEGRLEKTKRTTDSGTLIYKVGLTPAAPVRFQA